jgi:hypothetical protein
MRVLREILFNKPLKMFGRMRAGITETDATFEERKGGVVVIRGKAPGDRRFYEVPETSVTKVCEDVAE